MTITRPHPLSDVVDNVDQCLSDVEAVTRLQKGNLCTGTRKRPRHKKGHRGGLQYRSTDKRCWPYRACDGRVGERGARVAEDVAHGSARDAVHSSCFGSNTKPHTNNKGQESARATATTVQKRNDRAQYVHKKCRDRRISPAALPPVVVRQALYTFAIAKDETNMPSKAGKREMKHREAR